MNSSHAFDELREVLGSAFPGERPIPLQVLVVRLSNDQVHADHEQLNRVLNQGVPLVIDHIGMFYALHNEATQLDQVGRMQQNDVSQLQRQTDIALGTGTRHEILVLAAVARTSVLCQLQCDDFRAVLGFRLEHRAHCAFT